MTTLPDIIGHPPTDQATSYELTHNSLPVMEIEPMIPNFETAATLFTLNPDWTTYKKLLEKHLFTLSSEPIKLAYIADNFPTDSFTNQYSESFLNRFTDLVSTGTAELSQITGQKSASGAIGKMLDFMENSDIGMLNAFGSGAKGALSATKAGFKSVVSEMGGVGKRLENIGHMTNKLLGGARVDMPMIWKNSGFTPSYTITVRLYNPQPANQALKEKYIIGPIAAMLLLALPQTDDGVYYNWPFFCRIKVPGLLSIPSGYIGNVTLVKGGDQQQISYGQEMGMVDVRIEFGSLYDTMVVGSEYTSNARPTLKNYLDNMRDRRGVYVEDINGGPTQLEDDKKLETQTDGRINQGTVDMTSEPPSRVSSDDTTAAESLQINQPNVGNPPQDVSERHYERAFDSNGKPYWKEV